MDEKDLNNYTSKLFENYKIQRPPEDFTDKLMLKIEQVRHPVETESYFTGRKFILFFILTFSSLFALGYFLKDTNSEEKSVLNKINLQEYGFEKILKLLNFNLEIGLFAKLLIGSILILVIIDLLTGSVIDYIIDSKKK